MIRTARLILEPVTAEHAGPMFAGLQDQRAYRFIPQEPPESLATLQTRYAKLQSGRSPDGTEAWLNWMARHGDNFVGFIQATVIKAEYAALIAYQIFPACWRRGYGREATAAMLDHLAAHYAVREARACIDTRNTASIGLVESLGFTLCDTIQNADMFRGKPSDEYVYTKRLGP